MKLSKSKNLKLFVVFVIILLVGFGVGEYYKTYKTDSVLEAIKASKLRNTGIRGGILSGEGDTSQIPATELVANESKGGLVPNNAPEQYHRDEERFNFIKLLRVRLADYYEKKNSYPSVLTNDLIGDSVYGKDLVYIPNGNAYKLTVKFETKEAVIVGANIENQNRNAYDYDKSTVTFTEKSGNFFYFTGATANK